ncbi:MAG: hypothetical protein WB643_00005 [Candidatus Bathyarchaeia archaeon]
MGGFLRTCQVRESTFAQAKKLVSEATVALRMAFRQPEGISRFNATRLNAFVDENRYSIRFKRISSILKTWNIEDWVEKNLIDLYRRNRLRIIRDSKIIPGVEKKLG